MKNFLTSSVVSRILLMLKGKMIFGRVKNGEIAPCKDLDIRKGDVICKINGESVESIYKLKKTMKEVNY